MNSWLDNAISLDVSFFPFFSLKAGNIFNAKFHSYLVDSYGFYNGFYFFFILDKYLDHIYVSEMVYPCLWSCIFYPLLSFLNTWFIRNITVTNSRCDSEFPWKIPFWIFTSARVYPPVSHSRIQFLTALLMNFPNCYGILNIFSHSIVHVCWLGLQNTPIVSLHSGKTPPSGLDGWGCRIHRLYLCIGVKPRVWWWWWGSTKDAALGNAEYPFHAITPRSTLTRCGSTWEGPI